ncbi:phosphoglucomutase, partial [Halomonas sp. SUBG004]
MATFFFSKSAGTVFDDGLYSAARLLEILAQFPGDADTFFDQFPQDVSTPEINISVADDKITIIETLAREGDFGEGIKTTLDGIRVD